MGCSDGKTEVKPVLPMTAALSYGRKLCHFIFCSHDPVEIHLLSSALKFSQQPICLYECLYSPVDKINNIKTQGIICMTVCDQLEQKTNLYLLIL